MSWPIQESNRYISGQTLAFVILKIETRQVAIRFDDKFQVLEMRRIRRFDPGEVTTSSEREEVGSWRFSIDQNVLPWRA
jgi:hypothetical protein